MKKELILALMIGALCLFAYLLGKSQAKVEVVTKEVEVIRYVTREKAKIQARPNASRDELIGLMRGEKF